MTKRAILAAGLMVLLAGATAWAQPAATMPGEKVEVKHAFPPGTYTLTMTDQSDSTTTVAGQDQKHKSNETVVWELNIGQPNDKGIKPATLKLVRIKTSDQEGEKATAFDSDKPAEGQDAGKAFVYKALLGQPVQVSLDSDDTLVEVSGLDKLWTELAVKAGTDEEKSALAQVQVGLCDKAIELHLRRWESLTPRKAVAAGDAWQAGLRIDVPIIGEIKARYDCKLQSVEATPAGRLAVIAVQGAYENSTPKASKIMGQDVTLSKLAVQEKGTLKADLKTGLARADENTTDFSCEMTTKDKDGKDVAITVKSVIATQTVVEPKKPAGPVVVPGVE